MALRYLGLLDEHYRITSICEQLVHASGEHYRALLQTQLKVAYSALFARLDILPYVDHKLLKEVFSQCGYEPIAMQHKMVTLLKGLSLEAGMILERTSPLQDADGQSIEDARLFSKNALIPRADTAETGASDSMLTFLFRLPYCHDWTDADIPWWQQAVAQATTTTMRKVLRAAASNRPRDEQTLLCSRSQYRLLDT